MGRGIDPGRGQLRRIHACQHGYCEELWTRRHGPGSLVSCREHGSSAGRVHGEHPGSGLRYGPDSARHGIGYVVELQIQKDGVTEAANLLDDAIAFSKVEFQANLEPLDEAFQLMHGFERRRCPREIQGNDQLLARAGRGHTTSIEGDARQTHTIIVNRLAGKFRAKSIELLTVPVKG